MAIVTTKTHLSYWPACEKCGRTDQHTHEVVEHEGRVVAIKRYRENVNTSDTLDYSDYQVKECIEALVWLGPHGKANRYDLEERDLAIHEQFQWVPCSSYMSWRNLTHHEVAVDASPVTHEFTDGCTHYSEITVLQADVTKCHDPALATAWDGYLEHLARVKSKEADDAREHARLAAEEKAKRDAKEDAREAKKIARLEASQRAAQALLSSSPKKGARVKVGDFTGTVFWSGATKHRGKFSARLGVKDTSGKVVWCDATEAKPA